MNNVNREIVYGICNMVMGDCVRNMLHSVMGVGKEKSIFEFLPLQCIIAMYNAVK